MWGGIYAVLFSISAILSYEDPVKNGFPQSITESYVKHSLSAVEFQNKIVGKEVQYSFYEMVLPMLIFMVSMPGLYFQISPLDL